jgi:hypothetical protein
VPGAPAELNERDNGSGGTELVLADSSWRLSVDIGQRLDPYELVHLESGRYAADESYCYQLSVSGPTLSGFHGGPFALRRVVPLDWSLEREDGNATLVLLGRLDFGPQGPTGIRLEHRITLATSGEVLEQISLLHHAGRDHFALSELRFGLRKTLFDRTAFAWREGADTAELIPVPLRRRAGQGIDHLLGSYSAADLYPEEWTKRGSLPDRSSEAWLWCEDGGGLLIAKHDQEHIEFSVVDGEHVAPRTASSDGVALHLERLHSDRNLCMRLAGAGVSQGCPERAGELHPGQRLSFGPSIIAVYKGDWQAGYGRYKQLLRERGHVVPAGYDPKVHWNELYQLGWRCGSNAGLQELPELFTEAARAQAAGAQAYYFDPGWDLFEGSSIWDTERLGPIEDFVKRLRDDYGLSLSLHLMMHTKSLEEDPAIYRRDRDGEIVVWLDTTPYAGGFVCPASPVWQRQKIERLRTLAAAGASFFMFDFLSYERAGIEQAHLVRGEPQSCWSSEHGHSVPLTREEHAEGILTVIRAIKREFPELQIEAHDRVAGEFLPLYYQHGPADSYDELWGFEYMWDPYSDLLTGKALSLYEYNLAYDIPLYLHINSAHDSPSMLAFWWYASLCRHLGIGGLAEPDEQWPRLVEAMRRYRRLQDYFARGRFVGINRFTHLHVLEHGEGLEGGEGRKAGEAPGGDSAVLTAYNLGSKEVRRSVTITPAMLQLGSAAGAFDASSVAGAPARLEDGMLVVDLLLPPLSPAVVEIGVPPAARRATT